MLNWTEPTTVSKKFKQTELTKFSITLIALILFEERPGQTSVRIIFIFSDLTKSDNGLDRTDFDRTEQSTNIHTHVYSYLPIYLCIPSHLSFSRIVNSSGNAWHIKSGTIYIGILLNIKNLNLQQLLWSFIYNSILPPYYVTYIWISC